MRFIYCLALVFMAPLTIIGFAQELDGNSGERYYVPGLPRVESETRASYILQRDELAQRLLQRLGVPGLELVTTRNALPDALNRFTIGGFDLQGSLVNRADRDTKDQQSVFVQVKLYPTLELAHRALADILSRFAVAARRLGVSENAPGELAYGFNHDGEEIWFLRRNVVALVAVGRAERFERRSKRFVPLPNMELPPGQMARRYAAALDAELQSIKEQP